MENSPAPDASQVPPSSGLRDRFPGYFLPDDGELREFIERGLISFDTNALFDVYRFNESARLEFVNALRVLGERLWIPNRVGEELLGRRLTVIQECASATDSLTSNLKISFDGIKKQVREFGNRRGLSRDQVSEVEEIAQTAFTGMGNLLADFFKFDLTVDGAIREDPILRLLEDVLQDRIGPPFEDVKAATEEANRRIKEKIPPGYEDFKKDPEKAVGDYFLWRQLILQAKSRALPVVLVTNEQKNDWVREDLGKKLGPRPELVAEMLRETGLPFHLISVQSFLIHAKKFLGATVSESTVAQAEQVDEVRESPWLVPVPDMIEDTNFARFLRSVDTPPSDSSFLLIEKFQEGLAQIDRRLDDIRIGMDSLPDDFLATDAELGAIVRRKEILRAEYRRTRAERNQLIHARDLLMKQYMEDNN